LRRCDYADLFKPITLPANGFRPKVGITQRSA